MVDCAICLNRIELHSESYLYPCFHRFCFSCISEWTKSQQKHRAQQESGDSDFTCPLCKSPYSYVVYDYVGSSYRLWSPNGSAGSMQSMPLTAEQSRRRAVYVTNKPEQQQQAAQVPLSGRTPRPRAPNNQQTATWITRDLQAVLLDEDVGLIAQHVIGVLQSLAQQQAQARLKGPDVSPVYGNHAAFMHSISQAVAGFVEQEQAHTFTTELWAFLHSGLSVAAYDKFLFGADDEDEQEEDVSQGEQG